MATQQLNFATTLKKPVMTICPCCGFKLEGTLKDGCESCGAQSVGEALPRPENELPFYGRSLLLTVIGTLMVLVFLTQTIIAMVQKSTSSIGFWSIVSAAETAAWRLKWITIPVAFLVLWSGRKIYRSILSAPDRFCGLRYARRGLLASALVPALIAILIGVTVPERLRQRQLGIEAGFYARGYTIDRALLEYKLAFGTLPTDLRDLSRLPDQDGSVSAALAGLDTSGYKVTADLASLPTKKPRPLRGAVIMNASLNTPTNDAPQEGLSFTNYELPLPGPDKVLGTEDDLIVRDGVITQASAVVRRTTSVTTTARP
jgi:hypothetical protein